MDPSKKRSNQSATITLGGLIWFAILQAVSIPYAWLSSREWSRYVATDLTEAKDQFHVFAGIFHFTRSIADIGLLVSVAFGCWWLYQTWIGSFQKNRKAMSPIAVVGWSLVPIWGYWRLHDFLLELVVANKMREKDVRIDRWWWTLAMYFVLRVILAMVAIPGWGHMLESSIGIIAAFFGLKMICVFEHAQMKRMKTS